jgi:hypothetical protein
MDFLEQLSAKVQKNYGLLLLLFNCFSKSGRKFDLGKKVVQKLCIVVVFK